MTHTEISFSRIFVAFFFMVSFIFLIFPFPGFSSEYPFELPPFSGETGENAIALDGEISLDIDRFEKTPVRFFHTEIPEGKTVYFFVVKTPDGIFRAAANGCLFCYPTQLGFTFEGTSMKCVTCEYTFPLETIAIEDGSCHPIPISRSLEIRSSSVIIPLESLISLGEYF